MNKYMLLRQILKQHSLYPFSLFFIIFLIIGLKNASKVMLKILQARLQQYVNCELPDVQAGFRKDREEPEVKLPTSVGSLKKAREFQKDIYLCFIDYTKAFDCVDHNQLENS